MPYTGQVVDVPLHRIGPRLHVVKLENRESTTAITQPTPNDAREKPCRCEEYFTSASRLDEVLDPASSSARSTVSFTLAMDWRPWMNMDDVASFTLDPGIGGRLWRTDDLPADILHHLHKHQPDVLENPARWLPPLPA